MTLEKNQQEDGMHTPDLFLLGRSLCNPFFAFWVLFCYLLFKDFSKKSPQVAALYIYIDFVNAEIENPNVFR